jgi:hypothetical protein
MRVRWRSCGALYEIKLGNGREMGKQESLEPPISLSSALFVLSLRWTACKHIQRSQYISHNPHTPARAVPPALALALVLINARPLGPQSVLSSFPGTVGVG